MRKTGEEEQPERTPPRHANVGPTVPAAERGTASPGEFTLDDFRRQCEQIAKMGNKDVISLMPGMTILDGEDPEPALRRVQRMVDAMTSDEKADPTIIDRSRLRRIAADAGVRPYEVKQFLQEFLQIRALMKKMAAMSLWQRIKMVTGIGKPCGWITPGEAIR